MAAGDFNNDGFADLAVGAPGEDLEGVPAGVLDNAGVVHVIYGSAAGLGPAVADQVWRQDSPGMPDAAEVDDQFGSTLAAADLGSDAAADLAIGIPFEDIAQVTDAGAWLTLYGSATGLSTAGSQFWNQDSPGIADTAESDDRVALSLAAADFGKGAKADLAVGVPFEQSIGTIADAGAAHVVYGGPGGLSSTGSQFWHQNSASVQDSVEAFDFFSRALAAANLGKGERADLVVGVPGEDLGAAGDAGAINVLYGGSSGLTATANQLWHQNTSGVPGAAEAADEFGAALAAGNFGKTAEADVAVGAPLEDVGARADAGAVNVLYGRAAGLSSSGAQQWDQNSFPFGTPADAGDEFGRALSAWDFGRSAQSDLAVAAPREDFPGLPDAGAVDVLYARPSGLSAADHQFFPELVVSATPDANGHFGEVVIP